MSQLNRTAPRLRALGLGLLLAAVAVSAARGRADEPPTYTAYMPMVIADMGGPPLDMVPFMAGDGRLYEVRHSSGSQARHQTLFDGPRFYHTKGNEIKAEWEELWADETVIYRGTDTSPGDGRYYTLYEDNVAGSPWAPRFWNAGDLYERNPYVVFYEKSDCDVVASGFQRSWLRFEAFYPDYTFGSGITLRNVIELAWLLSPEGKPVESYFYAEGYGLVGWGSNDRGYSYVNEVHAPGQRPDNKREVIPCMGGTNRLRPTMALNYGPLSEGFRAK
jgi:hypothetical protein